MTKTIAIAMLVMTTGLVYAKQPRPYESGTLLRMDSAKCGTDQNNAKSLAGEILGTDSSHSKTHELLCQEYILQTDSTVFHFRPRDEKHPALLPIGSKVQFRIAKDKLLLRVEDFDNKERSYLVTSMTPRQAAQPAYSQRVESNKNSPERLALQ